jgi:hypothetical protein
MQIPAPYPRFYCTPRAASKRAGHYQLPQFGCVIPALALKNRVIAVLSAVVLHVVALQKLRIAANSADYGGR